MSLPGQLVVLIRHPFAGPSLHSTAHHPASSFTRPSSQGGRCVKFLLVGIAALLYAVGWAAGLVAVVVLWCWSAMAVGWDDARGLARREPVRAR